MTLGQRQQIVSIARSLVGKPYTHGAGSDEAPRTFDCSSFTQYCMKQVGIDIPRSSILQAAAENGKEIIPAPDCSNLESGDLLFFRGQRGHYNDEQFPGREVYVGHVALYLGEGLIVNAQAHTEPNGVAIESLADLVACDPRYRIVLVRRF